MITVGRRQIAALQAQADRDFALRALDVLRGLWPVELQALEPEALEAWAQAGVGEARGLGITGERDVCGLLNLRLIATGFRLSQDWPGWAADILARRQAAPSERLRDIFAAWSAQAA